MGEVYRARDPRIGREVAIKILPGYWSRDAERLRRFELEARAAGTLNHPALLTIYDVGEQDGTPYLVSELLEGETLRTRLRAGAVSPRRVIDHAIQIAHGLAAAHEKGVVHRDIKPENIFITKDGRVKILDFGVAKLQGTSSDNASTEPGAVMGTAGYMSPEQVRGEEVDQRSDIFSFGAVLYECLLGKAPFKRDSSIETMNAILTDDPPAITYPPLARVVSRCLEKHREARYQSAADLAFHLEEITEIPTSAPHAARGGRMSRPILAVMLVIVVAVIAAILFLNRRPTAASIHSIAVLPFENATGRGDLEYVSDGFSEELIDKLSELPGVRIIARTTAFTFKNKPLNLRTIAHDLDVDAVVVGKLTMRDNRAVLQADLVDVKTGSELWGARYDDVLGSGFRMQDRVAGDIGRRLGAHWNVETTREASTRNRPAYDEYLRGRYDLNQRTYASLESAAGHFRNAIKLDPDFAAAYAGLADTYLTLTGNQTVTNREEMERSASDAIEKALALAPDLAEAHASRGSLEQHRWNLRDADAEFRRAIAINPNLATARHWLSNDYRARGDYQNARRQSQDARRLDPLSPMVWSVGAMDAFDSGDDDAARAEAAEALAIAPGFSFAKFVGGVVAMDSRDFVQAENLFRQSTEKPILAYLGEAALANLYGRTGRIDAANAIIERLQHSQGKQYVSPVLLSYAYAGVGKNTEAIEWLKRGVDQRDLITGFLFRSRMLGDLTKDSRYQALIRSIDAQFRQQESHP